MSSVHLLEDGLWAACDAAACALPFHLPELTVAEAAALPEAMLWSLLEAIDPPHRVNAAGDRIWKDERSRFHRGYGLPAVIRTNGTREWRQEGKLHRLHGQPALISSRGTRQWYEANELHRVGGPAQVRSDGSEEWWQRGALHRLGGPAMALADGYQAWFLHGEHHNAFGPATIYPLGVVEYWLEGRECSEEDWFEKRSWYLADDERRMAAEQAGVRA